jgi:hypothetical protein
LFVTLFARLFLHPIGICNGLYRYSASACNKTQYTLTCSLLPISSVPRHSYNSTYFVPGLAKSAPWPLSHRDNLLAYRDNSATGASSAKTNALYCRAVIVHLRFLPDPKIDHDKRTINPVYFNKTNLHSETIHATSIVNLDNFAMVFALPSGRFYFDKKTSRRISGLSHLDNFI